MKVHLIACWFQRLAELITEEAKSLSTSYPVIRHNRMKMIVRQSELDMDEEELQQVGTGIVYMSC